ncbi:MAG TPA: ATP phosphoribosyltransferase regulatory subunit [Holophagaceae bacterium]|nr:ATP phosphoribosyltransferase regulatory subunit [Holophagaceae bacterium]
MPIRTPHFPDLLFDAAARLRSWESALLRLLADRGYRELRPSLVMREPMAGSALRFFDQDELVGLRWDYTEALARLLASRFNEPPARVAYAGAVFRRSAAHWEAVERFEVGCERLQAPEEDAAGADLELARLLMAVPAALGLKRGLLHLGDAALWRRPLEAEDIPAPLAGAATRALHQRAPHRVREALEGHPAAARVSEHAALLALAPDGAAGLDRLSESPYAELTAAGREQLAARFEALRPMLPPGLELRLDLADVADLDFYTGPTLRLWAPGATAGLAAGGRYDRLYPELGRPWQAAGFCVRLSTLLELLDNRPDLFEATP